MPARTFRLVPSASRQRGLASIGLELTVPRELELMPSTSGSVVVRCTERGPGGLIRGELEVSLFTASLLIDRDGILEEKACEAADREAAAAVQATMAVTFPGASGYRADVALLGGEPPALPYVSVFALAPDLAFDAGVIVIMRSAGADWTGGDAVLGSLRILTRHNALDADADD